MKKIYLLFLLSIGVFNLQAQLGEGRYMEEIFDNVNVTTGVTYTSNATVLFYGQIGQAVPQALQMDVYSPSGDTETERPLVILAHSGNFLPFPLNGGVNGQRTDMTLVEIANRLAKRGYVVASIDYRLGWNPIATTQTERVTTLINAAYRGMQDARTCNRFFRHSAANGNPYGINPEKIALWGIGTGGYIAQAVGHLDDYNEVLIPKFIIETPNGPQPMVIEIVNGGVDGNGWGVNPLDGDTLNYQDETLASFSSEFKLTTNMGGATGDKSWVDENSVPQISFHVPTDPFAPCGDGVVNVPPPINLPVVDVSGSCVIVPLLNDNGVNSILTPAWSPLDIYTEAANATNGGAEGLMLFSSSDPTESAPWDMWDETNENSPGTPDNASAMIYIDSIMGYWAPRACQALSLGCNIVDTKDLTDEVSLSIAPNPATTEVTFTTDAYEMTSVYLYDLQGRLVQAHTGVDANYFTLQRNNLGTGMYIAELRFAEGTVTKKIVFE